MKKNKTSKKLNRISQLGSQKLLKHVLNREAVIIYSPKLERIIWSNVSGANLFGGRSISKFMALDVEPDHPFLKQVKSAVRQLDKEPIYRGFRVVKNGHSRFLQCEIDYIKLNEMGKGRKKGIIITAANSLMEDLPENEFANLALDNLANIGSDRAICDRFGLIISATESFANLDISADTMENLSENLTGNSQKPVQISVGENQNIMLNLYALGDGTGRFIVSAGDSFSKLKLLDKETVEVQSEPDDQPDETDLPEEQAIINGENAIPVNQDADFKSDEDIDTTTTPVTLVSNEFRTAEESLEVDAEENHESSNETDLQEAQSNIAESLDNDTPEKSEDNDDVDETGDAEFSKFQDGFVFPGGADPVRFAWITNTDQVFTFVSKELADAVGPNAADIVGRKWSDVATVFGFDRNNEILSLLKKQDTWSGKSVLWPVQGTDLHVPVDLAALPTFSSGRNFDGFRGFGIVRMLDTIVDPEETGLALVGVNINDSDVNDNEKDVGAEQKTVDDDDNSGVLSSAPTNIVNLDLRRETKLEDTGQQLTDESELTNKENRAFHEIGQKLRDSSKNNSIKLHNNRDKRIEDKSSDRDESTESPKPIIALRDANQSDDGNHAPAEKSVFHHIDNSMLSKLPVPVLVYRGNDTLFANRELLALTGYDSFQELSDAGGINALFAGDDSLELTNEHEVILNDRDGGQMYVKALLQNVPWDGENAMLLSFRQPKHDKMPENEKIVLDMMRVSELHNILDTATDGIIILNREGVIQSANQSAEALFGQIEEHFLNKSITELFASESHKRINDLLKSLRETNSKSLMNDGCEVIGIEANGGLIPLFITIGNVGTAENYCVILRDMTPWKKTREELVEAKKQAEDANEQKSEFLARISHEIRTPLNAIIGFSDVMIEERFGPIDNERYREYLRDINRSGIHVLDLINDLLDISKIEAGKMELSFEAVDLNQIVGETVALLQPQANGNRVLIRTSLSRAVPKVVADTRSIRQIVLNLVSNAIKFTEANGQVIVSTVYEGNGEVALRVRDTGRGMSEEDISIALKPFRQLNTISETRGQGTGLGLPLTKALVEANKAYFDIESKPGEGTIVLIQFPTQRVLAD